MRAPLWENAPAIQAVKRAPSMEIVLATEKLKDWQKVIGHIDALLVLPEVRAKDKMTLVLERLVAAVGVRACERLIAEAEAESLRQMSQFQARWGHLL